MCGIYGYFGDKDAKFQVLEGLKRLEYRGYDSWGIAVQSNNSIYLEKEIGKISDYINLEKLPISHIGIGHTRWATHGSVTQTNAHPQSSTDNSFVLAQNGIVQNYVSLKKSLCNDGYKFITETDTEVIVRLIEKKQKSQTSLFSSVVESFKLLEGRNTIILLNNKDDEIIAARNGSPLIIGFNDNTNEIFFSSDTLSFSPFADKMYVMENFQIAHLKNGVIKILDLNSGEPVDLIWEDLKLSNTRVDKEGYDHFMIKEIYDIPSTVQQIINQDKEKLESAVVDIKNAQNVYCIGSGSTGIAAAQIAFYLRKYSKINAVSLVGADCEEYFDLFSSKDLIIAPSQSGETADVLEVLEIAKKKGVKIITLVNMQGSTMTRIADISFMNNAGPEIAVVSTKVFISQISWGYLLSKAIQNDYITGVDHLNKLSINIKNYLDSDKDQIVIKTLANKLANSRDIFLLSKAQNFQVVREGMVKLMEGAYKHSHAIPAGDLKHYAITLMEPGLNVIVAISNDEVREDIINSANQVRARGAYVIGIASQNEECFDEFIKILDSGETDAIAHVIPLQLLAYYISLEINIDIDKPRNIAKSSTVK